MSDLLRAYDRECRERLRVGDPLCRVERDARVTRVLGPTDLAYENSVVWSRLTVSTADEEIRRQIAHFEAAGRDFEWKHYSHDGPRDLDVRLGQAGFRRGEPETLMFLEAEAARPKLRSTPFRIRRIGPKRLREVLNLQVAVSGLDLAWLEAGLRRELQHDPEGISIYVADMDGLPVATGWIRFGPRFATIHGGATLAEWRGKGAYSGILAARVGEARARGVTWVVSDSTEMSRPRLERKGFFPAATTTPFVWRRRG